MEAEKRHPYYNLKHNMPDSALKKLLGIPQDRELDKELEKSAETPFKDLINHEHFPVEEKPVPLSKLEILYQTGWLDFNKNLIDQMTGKIKPSEKKTKTVANFLKIYISDFVKKEMYDEAIKGIENLFGLCQNGNLEYYYILRNMHVKSAMSSKENRAYKLEKIIGLEKALTKFEYDLTGIDNKLESGTILNILEDCREADGKLFSRMMKFVDNYYNRSKITI